MTQPQTLDRDRTAIIIMDFHNRIVNHVARDPQGVVQRAAQVLEGARRMGIPVIHIVLGGRGFETGSPDAQIHPGVAPTPGEPVIAKTKWGAFSTTGLDVLLREMRRDTLVLMGLSTSGCVLSTMRAAFDLGYKPVVIADACDDQDPEVHQVLTKKIFPLQGTVLTAEEFLQAAGAS